MYVWTEVDTLLWNSEHNLSADPESFETSDEQTEDLEALTFDDLLSFAFQVARGMEFLSSKNVGGKHQTNICLFCSSVLMINLDLYWQTKPETPVLVS